MIFNKKRQLGKTKMSTASSDNITIAKVTKGASSTAIWKFEDWNECHAFLTSSSSCVMQIENVLLRFYLLPTQESYTKDLLPGVEYLAKNNSRHIHKLKFYSLWVEVLSGQMELFIKVKSQKETSVTIENESMVVFRRTSSNSDSRRLVFERFLYTGYSYMSTSNGTLSDYNDAPRCLNIHITAEIFKLDKIDIMETLESSKYEPPQQRSLVEDFKKLLIDTVEDGNVHHDVELKMDDGTIIPAHRAILAARSSVFQAMFSSGMKESVEKTVPIKKISPQAMKVILLYIYTEKIHDDWGNCVDGVVRAANMYDIPELLDHVDKNLIKICNVGNTLELYKLAKLYSMTTAMKNLTDFTQAHTTEVLLNMRTVDNLHD